MRDDQAGDARLGYEIALEPLDRISIELKDTVSDTEDHVDQVHTWLVGSSRRSRSALYSIALANSSLKDHMR